MKLPVHSWTKTLASLGLVVKRVPKPRNTSPCQLSMESLEARQLLTASPLYWDADGIAGNNVVGTGAGLGGTGNWNTSSALWYDPTSGNDVVWSGTAQAVFEGTAGTVTASSGLTADSLVFSTTGYTIQSGSLGLSGANTIDVGSGLSDTISTQLTGSNSLTKTGSGTLVLSGSNNYSGGTIVSAGTLRLNNVAGAGTGLIEIGNGTLSLFRSGATTTYSNAIKSQSGTSGTLTVDGSGLDAGGLTNSTYATGTITVDGTLTVSRPTGGTGHTVFSGALAGSGTLTVANSNGGTAPSITAIGRNYFSNTSNTFNGSVQILNGGNFLNSAPSITYTSVDIASGGYWTLQGATTTTVGALTGAGNITKGIVVDTATLSVGNGNANGNFSGVISQSLLLALGTVALTKTGSGTQILSGANTYGGTTTVSGGTLQIGNGGTTGTLGSGSVTNNGAIAFNRSNSITVSNVISGSGSVAQNGSGTLTLSGSNSYSGGSTVSAGTLRLTNVAGAGTGTIQIGNGTLSLFRSGSTTTYGNAITSQSGASGTLTVDGSGSDAGTGTNSTYATGTITVDGTLTVSRPTGGTGSTVFSGLLTGSGTLIVGNANGGTAPSTTALGRDYFTNGSNTFNGSVQILNGGNFLNNVASVTYTSVDISSGGYWTLPGGGTTTTVGALTGAGNITKGVVNDTANLSVGNGNANGNFSGVISQTLLSALGTVTLTKTGTGTQILSGANTYGGTTTISGGTLQIGNGSTTGTLGTGSVTDNATLAFNRSNSITVSNVISGSGSVAQNGSGTLTLSGSNSYSGGSIVNAGTLRLTNVAGAGTGTIQIGNGTLSLFRSGSTTTYGNAITSQTGKSGTLTVDGSGSDAGGLTNSTYATGTITVDGTLTVSRPTGGTGHTAFTAVLAGSGTLIAANSNGGTAPSSAAIGRDYFSNTSNTFNGSVQVLSGGNFLNSAPSIPYTSVDIASGGNWTLIGGTTTTVGALTGAGNITKSIVADTASLSVGNGNANGNFSGVISQTLLAAMGTVALTKIGTGTQILTGTNTYGGTTTVTGGTLQIGNGAGAGALSSSSSISVGSSGTLAYNRNDSGTEYTIANNVSGSGAWTFTSPGGTRVGRYSLTGDNSGFTGSMTIDHARLNVTAANHLGSGSITVNTQGQLLGNGGTYTNNVSLNGTGWIETVGNLGALRLRTNAVWSGSVMLLGDSTIGNYTNESGTISGDITESGGSHDLTKVGPGTITLSGDNSGLTGQIAVAAGTLVLGSTDSGSASAAWQIDSGAKLLSSADVELGSLSGGTGAQVSNTYHAFPAASTVTLTIGALGTDTTYAGLITDNGSGVTSIIKVGAGILTLTGENTYTGGTFYDDPTLTPAPDTGPVEQSMQYYQVTISAKHHGDSALTISGDLTASSRWIRATSWQDAVQRAVSGSVTTSSSPTTGPSTTYTFQVGDPNNSSVAKNASFGDNATPDPNRGTAFLITDQFYIGGTLQSGRYIALEDLYGNSYVPPGYDADYNDDYWTVDVKQSKDPSLNNCFECPVIDAVGATAATPTGALLDGVSITGVAATAVHDTVRSVISDPVGSPSAGSYVSTGNLTQILAMDSTDHWPDPYKIVAVQGVNAELFQRMGVDPLDSNLVNYAPATGNSAGGQELLVHNISADTYTLTSPNGWVITLAGLSASQPAAKAGQVLSESNNGVTTTITYDTDGRVSDVQTTTGTSGLLSEQSAYLTGSDPNAGLRSTVTQRVSSDNGAHWAVNRVTYYSYYSDGDAQGSKGDLTTVVVKDALGNTLDTQYFRYYTTDTFDGSQQIGYKHGLKTEFGTASYARLVAAGFSTSSTDAQLQPYLDQYFEYDAQLRVTAHFVQGEGCTVCSGGQGEYTYTYSSSSVTNPDPSGDPNAYNVWTNKLVETLPDGNTNTLYTNKYGQTILKVFTDMTTSQQWADFYRYAPSGVNEGKEILHANPSAIASISESDADLVTLYAGQGLIDLTEYYTTTTATETTAGGVAGYVEDHQIERGTSGTHVLQDTMDYFQRSGGGTTVFQLADYTVYRNEDGTGAETTSFAYTWFTGTTQIESTTTTLPVISMAQNGSGVADQLTTFNDLFGRPIWTQDADGFLTYIEYDQATGAVVKTIQDVDTTQTGDFTDLPGGWTTPSGGGLHLVTTYAVDSLGRTTQTTDANGNVSFNVYNDANHEVRTYSGFTWDPLAHSGAGAYVQMSDPPPTRVFRQDLPGSYYETLTMSATPTVDGDGVPTGTEAISNIQTLSRSYMNDAGQMVTSDAYFDFTGMTYSTAANLGTQDVNFYRTTYRYDHRGRLERTVDPTGTITRLVYDGLGRTVSTWVGTDDTPATGFWSPTNNTGANMVQLSQNQYDGGGVGDSNLTQITLLPGGSADPRVTQLHYDWRDRLVAMKAGVEATESTSTNRPIGYTVLDNLGEAAQSLLYDGDAVTLVDANSDGVPDQPSAGLLRAKTVTSYDDQGRVFQTSVYDVDPSTGTVGSGPHESNLFYDPRSMISSSTDALDRATAYEYDGVGRLLATTLPDPDGAGPQTSPVYQSTYDGVGNKLTQTDPLGNVTTYEYDQANRLVSVTQPDPDGAGTLSSPVTTYSYNVAGWLDSVTDPLLRVTSYEYDRLGRTISTTLPDPDGAGPLSSPVYQTTYDGVGHVLTQTDALGSVTSYEYDPTFQWLVQATQPDPDGAGPLASPVTQYAYNNLGDLLSMTDPLNRVTTYEYNVLGQQITVTQPDPDGAGMEVAPVTSYAFDTLVNMASMTDALGNVTQYAHDSFGRLVSVTETDPDGAGPENSPLTSFTYDAAGQLLSMTDPLGRVTSYEYDDLGRTITVTSPDPDGLGAGLAPVTHNSYDLAGNLLSQEVEISTGHSDTTTYGYDNLYRRTSITDANSDTIEYTFDAVGNTLSVTDPIGNATVYAYDNLNRLISDTITVDSVDLTRNYTYDAVGNRLTLTNRDGRVTQYDYDNLYRLIDEKWMSGMTVLHELDYTYDAASQMLTAGDDAAQYAYAYDDLGRMASDTQNLSGLTPEIVLAYGYDAVSNRLQTATMIGGMEDAVTDYTFNNLYRTIRVAQHGVSGGNAVAEKRIDMGYDIASQRQSIDRYADLAGTQLVASTAYSFDDDSRLTSLTHTKGATTFADYAWQYDQASWVTQLAYSSLVGSSGSSDYSYDDRGQVTAANHDYQADEDYTYDENGNRTTGIESNNYSSATFSTGDQNRLTSDGTYDYEYDGEGNRTRRTNIVTDEVTVYSWDYHDRLTSVTTYANASDADTATSPTRQVDYSYDVFDRRIAKLIDADGDATIDQTARYAYDGSEIALQFNGDAAADLAHRYVFGNEIDQILADERVNSLASAGDVLWPLTDNQGSVRDLASYDAGTDTSSVANHLVYDSFGNVTSETAPSEDFAFGYTGRERDEETGLNYYRRRYTDPATGGFISADPANADINTYRYGDNSPTNGRDPSGLGFWSDYWHYLTEDAATVGGAIGSAATTTANVAVEEARILPGTVTNLPAAYVHTASNGQQASSLAGYTDSLTDTINPFGGGTDLGPQYGHVRDYENGQTVGTGTGFVMNTVMTVNGVQGTVKSIQAIRTASGLIQTAEFVTVGGRTLQYAWVNGRAVALSANLALQLSVAGAGANNLIKMAADAGSGSGGCPSDATRRTPAENAKARNQYKNNKDAARKAYEERTGQKWPVDENGNMWPGEHTPPLKEGGDPMIVTPRDPGGIDPHNIPGPDGLTDYQRWGAEGTPAREANRKGL